MGNMNKGLTVHTKMGADKLAKQNLSAQIVCQSPKVWDFDEKRFHWASVVRDFWYAQWVEVDF